ncbi:MAG: imidazole glycerol phosphate synthase subunit HisF [Candidatus Lokiarchaeota archaeon]|nr:imidazole glycerol phosphate synthase subunit HisF [Candidatus Lokiarchaeota archaeon]MBD3201897.1 imidazole glycerol phosphate synthase subunit HisF [Candidatus Lokiarchaeota archaeon]
MVLTKRIIPCLDVTDGRVVKGVQFVELKDAGDAVELGKYYDEQGADELVFLDITASSDKRKILIDLVERTGEEIFIPFTVGGGLRSVKDIKEILRAGADKVSINTAAVKTPEVIHKGSKQFGSQCLVTAIDAKRVYIESLDDIDDKNVIKIPENNKYCWWEVYIHGGRTPTGLDAIDWGLQVQKLGSGEILLTSMDMDGVKEGYDLELTKAFSERLDIPIIASGGAGSPQHIVDAFKIGKADAALAASIFHYDEFSIHQVKEICKENGIPMRL